MEVRREWNDIIKMRKENNFQSRILHPLKILFKDKNKIFYANKTDRIYNKYTALK